MVSSTRGTLEGAFSGCEWKTGPLESVGGISCEWERAGDGPREFGGASEVEGRRSPLWEFRVFLLWVPRRLFLIEFLISSLFMEFSSRLAMPILASSVVISEDKCLFMPSILTAMAEPSVGRRSRNPLSHFSLFAEEMALTISRSSTATLWLMSAWDTLLTMTDSSFSI